MKTLISAFAILLTAGLAHAHVYSSNLWPNYEVTVCFHEGFSNPFKVGKYSFDTDDWSQLERQKVQAWVNEDFSFTKTGIHFVGFKDCKKTLDPDVVLFYTRDNRILDRIHEWALRKAPNLPLRGMNPPGIGTVGSKPGLLAPYSTAKGFIVLGTTGMNKRTVIHEFGHVAGFSHEHLHPDAIKVKKNCIHLPTKEKIPLDSTLTEYDKSSVMDYCTFMTINMQKGLSPKDEETLKSLYP